MTKQQAPQTLVSIYLDENDTEPYAMKLKRSHNKLEFFGASQFTGMGWIVHSLVAVAMTLAMLWLLI